MSTYNGWTNYATWRINLEIVDDAFSGSDFSDWSSTYELAQSMKDYVEEILYDKGESPAVDYAMAFIAEVNWQEIASHYENEIAEANKVPETCKYCGDNITEDSKGTWVDDTDGDVCSGNDDLENENGSHQP